VQNRLLLALCFLSATSFGQNTGPTGPDTEYAPCLEGQAGTRVYESPQLTSSDGLWRAYASVEAKPDPRLNCSDTSTLLIKGSGEASFQLVHTIKPDPQMVGNGMKPISWSTQRHLLAVQVLYWQYGSDAGGVSLLIYDADRKRIIEPDLAKLFARRYKREECAYEMGEVLGFDSHNRVPFEAGDDMIATENGTDPKSTCLGGPIEWALDIYTNQLELLRHLGSDHNQ
jgi:hypothetical protein